MKTVRALFAGLVIATVLFGARIAKAQSNDSENRTVRIINRASSPIFHLYISNAYQTTWGPDQLKIFEVISSGYYRNFNIDDGSGHCLYDVKAVLQDNREAITLRLNVCTKDTWTVTDN